MKVKIDVRQEEGIKDKRLAADLLADWDVAFDENNIKVMPTDDEFIFLIEGEMAEEELISEIRKIIENEENEE